MQLLIIEFNFKLSFQSISLILPFSNTLLIFFGNFSHFFKRSSLKKNSSNFLSISVNKKSSLSFKEFLIFVNIFWISDFNSSLFLFFSSNIFFNSSIFCCRFLDKSVKYLILSFNSFFFYLLFL